jgi:hypothetical protein
MLLYLDFHSLLRLVDKVYISTIKRVKSNVCKKSNNGAIFRETIVRHDPPRIMDRPESTAVIKTGCRNGFFMAALVSSEMKERRPGQPEGGSEKVRLSHFTATYKTGKTAGASIPGKCA